MITDLTRRTQVASAKPVSARITRPTFVDLDRLGAREDVRALLGEALDQEARAGPHALADRDPRLDAVAVGAHLHFVALAIPSARSR